MGRIEINGQTWTYRATSIGDERPERRYDFLCHGRSSIPGVIGFYSHSIDAGFARIREGR